MSEVQRRCSTSIARDEPTEGALEGAPPIGTELVSRRRTKRKVTVIGTASTSQRRFIHHLNWEIEHGPIPEGFVLKSRDGDSLNVDPSNWVLMPAGMHSRALARISAAPPELKETAIANEVLKTQINKFKAQHSLPNERMNLLNAARYRRRYEVVKKRMLEDPDYAAKVRARWQKNELIRQTRLRARMKDRLT